MTRRINQDSKRHPRVENKGTVAASRHKTIIAAFVRHITNSNGVAYTIVLSCQGLEGSYDHPNEIEAHRYSEWNDGAGESREETT
mmetsp:Transcript_20419/g.46364  ORF Transcript_20419/g.46364 Transcript_20419/m.46364 type:complete len:85 (-) Transcript_20419:689-943(-)